LLIAALGGAAELPVTNVVLYKHGVGYFERIGELAPGETAQLDFHASEMDDVLKSFTIDTSSGAIAALRYDASEPVERKLAKFPIRLDPGRPLSYLLDQIKGEQLELRIGSDTVRGTIIGARVQPGTQEQAEREQVTLLIESGELRTIDLSPATSIRFTDAELQTQLREYLAVLSGARSEEQRSVYIDSTGTARRDVRVGYMIPTPVWKSSYRLLFPESGEPTLEGWAIVDNTTAEDWTDVRLALVSGRPISFVSSLYEPKYVTRPRAELPEDRAQAPVVYEGGVGVVGGVAAAAPQEMELMSPMMEAPVRNELRARAAMGGVTAGTPAAVPAPSTLAATAQGRDLGELFEYRFDEPVTVRQNESAMLPFLQQEVTARKLLIYSDQNSRNPMNAAEITNSTGKTLDGGPITVFDGGAYAGEALVETVKAGDERLISYGVDLGTRITTAFDSERARVREVHLRRGVLTATSAIRETRTYTINNVDQRGKTLVIEHPARPGYDLLNQEPSERTSSAYRFEVELAAGAERTFPVEEERTLQQTQQVANLTPDVLVTYVENQELSATAREQLGRILDQKRELAEATGAIGRTEREINEIANDQNRIRENISSLNRVSGQQEQVQRYADELARQEVTLASLRDRLSELRQSQTDLQSELNRMIEAMEF